MPASPKIIYLSSLIVYFSHLTFDTHKSNQIILTVCLKFLLSMMQNITNVVIWDILVNKFPLSFIPVPCK